MAAAGRLGLPAVLGVLAVVSIHRFILNLNFDLCSTVSYRCFGSRLFVTPHEGCKNFSLGKQALLQTFLYPGWYNTRNKKTSRTACNRARTETLQITLCLLLSGNIHQCPGPSTPVTVNQPQDSGSQTHNFWGNTPILHLINKIFRFLARPCCTSLSELCSVISWIQLGWGTRLLIARVTVEVPAWWRAHFAAARAAAGDSYRRGVDSIGNGDTLRNQRSHVWISALMRVSVTHFTWLHYIQVEQRKRTAPAIVIKNLSITPGKTNKHWQWCPLNHCLSTKLSLKVVGVWKILDKDP